MKNLLIGIVIGIIIGSGITFLLMNKKIVELDIPISIDVPVPVQENEFEPIENPKPIKVDTFQLVIKNPINEQLSNELDRANSIIDSLKVLKDFAVKRTYKETFEDSIQTITVNAETTGTLDKIGVAYKTKKYTIPLDTTIRVKVPQKPLLYLGGDLILPAQNGTTNLQPSVAPGLLFIEKSKKKAYKFNYDLANKTLQAGIYFNF